MKNENYFTVHGWMINELKLSGNELNLYAFIYGFSKEGNMFKGALRYIADSLGISKQSTIESLKKLVEKKFIIKYKTGSEGHIKCDYEVNRKKIEKFCGQESLPQKDRAVKKVDRDSQESLPHGGQESLPPSGQETCLHKDHNKIYKHKDINNNAEYKQALELSELFLASHRKVIPDYLSGMNENEIKKILVEWAEPIELLIRKEKKDPDIIKQVILWVKTAGNFWFSNILSGEKLRKEFERLYSQMIIDKKYKTKKHKIAADNIPADEVEKYFRRE